MSPEHTGLSGFTGDSCSVCSSIPGEIKTRSEPRPSGPQTACTPGTPWPRVITHHFLALHTRHTTITTTHTRIVTIKVAKLFHEKRKAGAIGDLTVASARSADLHVGYTYS